MEVVVATVVATDIDVDMAAVAAIIAAVAALTDSHVMSVQASPFEAPSQGFFRTKSRYNPYCNTSSKQ